MKFFKDIGIFDRIPPYYGVIWQCKDRHLVWCCWVPFNLLIRWTVAFWCWLHGPIRFFDAVYENAYLSKRVKDLERDLQRARLQLTLQEDALKRKAG